MRAVRTALAAPDRAGPVLIAFSGGLDSTVLLDAVSRVLPPGELLAAHVHHGIQPAADAWPTHCEEQARARGLRFECIRLDDAPGPGDSLEAWARQSRYAALLGLAHRCGASTLLTAHHADDQVETLLMRIARGTGIDGLGGVQRDGSRNGCRLLRPLLSLPRRCLHDYALRHDLRWVEDPSNVDARRLRNALRHQVLPALDAAAPGFRRGMLRLSASCDDARDAIAALADIDLAAAGWRDDASAGPLDAFRLALLTPARRRAALRRWLAMLGLRMPTAARLEQIDRQLLGERRGGGLITHEGWSLRRDRGALHALPDATTSRCRAAVRPDGIVLRWSGEPTIHLPAFHGALCFDPSPGRGAGPGVSQAWLRRVQLLVRPGGGPGGGAARLRPTPDGRSRTLKNLYQEAGIPGWMRPGLPLVCADGRLLFAAGLGMDRDARWPVEPDCVALRWLPDPPTASMAPV